MPSSYFAHTEPRIEAPPNPHGLPANSKIPVEDTPDLPTKNRLVRFNVRRDGVRDLARNMVTSPAYLNSLRLRADSGTLPPAIEIMLWHYAYGKPVERIEVNDVTPHDLSTLTVAQLAERADLIARSLRAGESQDPAPATESIDIAAMPIGYTESDELAANVDELLVQVRDVPPE